MGPDLLEGDVELTEFTEIEVKSIKGVKQGANGFPVLLMKGLPGPAEVAKGGRDCPSCGKNHDADHKGNTCESCGAKLPASDDSDGGAGKSAADHAAAAVAKAVTDGQVDEKPDVALGQQIMGLLGQAIANEAQEISAGAYGETQDVKMLARAADIVSCWCAREQAVADGQDPDAPCGCCPYCSGMGCGCCPSCGFGALMCSAADEAAKAKPGDGTKPPVAAKETTVHTDAQETGSLSKAVEDGIAKAMGPIEKRLTALDEGLAKVMAAPVPGGPVLSAVRPQVAAPDSDWAAKAAYYRQKADVVVDPAARDGYRQLAREADEEARKAQQPT